MQKTDLSPYNTINAIRNDSSLDRDAKISALLDLGIDQFGLDIGIVSHIKDGMYTVLYCRPSDSGIEPGTTFDIGVTYCSLTIKLTVPLMIAYATNSEYRRHPCREAFSLESYIGARFAYSDGALGTVNFSSTNPHAPFLLEDRKLVHEMACVVSRLVCEEMTV